MKRGPKSIEDTMIKPSPSLYESPEPPKDLTAKERQIWVETIESQVAGWYQQSFAETLAAYCQEVVHRKRLHRLLRTFKDSELRLDAASDKRREFLALTTLSQKAAASVASLATKLRLTPQSRYTPQAAATAAKAAPTTRKPWIRDLT